MKTFLLSLSMTLLIYGMQARAQTNCNIHGIIADSLKKVLSNTTIKLYFGKDSLNTTTNDKGYFSFSNIKAKEVTLKVSSIGFKTYLAKYSIKSDMQEIDLGTIVLKAGEISLADVTIKAKPVAIRYKQDTVEYDANAFHVQDEDRVTDLLKQLPGVEVDENENVTAMGKSMTKLRVNGKDFFTNNVKDFISKLPAGIVAKIQVIDDFGDQANFTGIKIGESQKMLNIVTKPGMDNGQFGGLSINGGTNKQIGGNGNVNLWNGEKQSSGGLGYNIADNGAGLYQNRTFGINHNNKIGKNASFGLNYNYNGGINNSKTLQAVETVNTLGKLNSQLENDNYSANNGHGLGEVLIKLPRKYIYQVLLISIIITPTLVTVH
ncbi:carboxypeptidase-like regulatory domain-containing protein [Pedobacter sp. HDW13]|uniref:carboxypeptidase-like regulatory domain-containing protein n=1 Tax=Pedobacter sp. HDW13 TaxID=2714940 RepID=UPI001408EBFF|nr:carboxypeptidase-like regulatory domain-containing protein [Pedobacter sp. HDW13]QIL39142.1 carboxypeptidase-like regulatory domain-containing protein [Pedobacter sp. HDW13]